MKTKLFSLVCALCLALPYTVLRAEETETEITLFEISGPGNLIGDEPLDGPRGDSFNPPRPNDFHATISGRILEVSVDNSNLTTVIVRNAAGNTVVDDSFYALTSQQLSSAGTYTLEIHNADMTLIGQFEAE